MAGSNILAGSGSIGEKVGNTVASAVALQNEIQNVDPNDKDAQVKLQQLQAKMTNLKMFLDKMKELEGDMRDILKSAMRKGQSS